MTPPRTLTSRASELKHEAILEAALELFVEQGFHGTAVPAVAERAHVGAGTIYRYFENKEDLVNALYRKWKGALSEQVLADFPASAPSRDQFHAIWHGMARFVADHPKAFAFLELHHHASYLDAESKQVESGLIEFATGFVAAAQQRKERRDGPPILLMSLIYGAFTGMVRAHWEGRVELTDDNWTLAERCCWEAIRYREP